MPLIFAYGTLQDETVQLRLLGRRLGGHQDALVGFQQTTVKIRDPEAAAKLGNTYHPSVEPNGNQQSSVPGMVFEITEEELARIDRYELEYCYERVEGKLASGARAWVYVYR
jgi:gamma-glutamylcyclotransferase (GGCT)/AIG2-like uncharacterized protein YtfP